PQAHHQQSDERLHLEPHDEDQEQHQGGSGAEGRPGGGGHGEALLLLSAISTESELGYGQSHQNTTSGGGRWNGFTSTSRDSNIRTKSVKRRPDDVPDRRDIPAASKGDR